VLDGQPNWGGFKTKTEENYRNLGGSGREKIGYVGARQKGRRLLGEGEPVVFLITMMRKTSGRELGSGGMGKNHGF